MGWEFVIYLAVAAVLAYAVAPKPPAQQPPNAGEAEAPVAEEGRAIGWVFGDVIVKGASVTWYGDISTDPIRKSGGKK